jgi:8-oxo-dGTP diphosphatase
LIKRKNNPFINHWALPGGFVDMEETLEEAIKRELCEETSLKNIDLKQFHTYGNLNRDPRGRTVSVVYYGFLKDENRFIEAGDDAKDVKWFQLNDIPFLAFDHGKIIEELNNFLQLV